MTQKLILPLLILNKPNFQIVSGQGTNAVQVRYLGGWQLPNSTPYQIRLSVIASGTCNNYNAQSFQVGPGIIFCDYFKSNQTIVQGENVTFTLVNNHKILANNRVDIKWYDLNGRLLATTIGQVNSTKIQSKLPSMPKGIVFARINNSLASTTIRVITQ